MHATYHLRFLPALLPGYLISQSFSLFNPRHSHKVSSSVLSEFLFEISIKVIVNITHGNLPGFRFSCFFFSRLSSQLFPILLTVAVLRFILEIFSGLLPLFFLGALPKSLRTSKLQSETSRKILRKTGASQKHFGAQSWVEL